MNRHRCEPLDHHHNNGTYLRVLLAAPTTGLPATGETYGNVSIETTRVVILTAPSLRTLDEHTRRLRRAAAQVDWDLRPADGMHRRIIERLHTKPALP